MDVFVQAQDENFKGLERYLQGDCSPVKYLKEFTVNMFSTYFLLKLIF